MSLRRTEFVATIGPASSSPEVLEQLILAGMKCGAFKLFSWQC